jgi:hypothetical protein
LLFLGGGFGGPLVTVEAATARVLGTLGWRDQAGTAALALSTTVRRLEGCLRYLPESLRRVLELIAGVNAPVALSPEIVAEQLHVTMSRVSRLERLALRRLGLTARTHACGVATPGPTDPFALSGLAVLVGEEGGPAGGVDAARNAMSASPDPVVLPASASSQGGDELLGIDNPSPENVGMLLILALVGGVLSAGLLFADRRRWAIHRELLVRLDCAITPVAITTDSSSPLEPTQPREFSADASDSGEPLSTAATSEPRSTKISS